MHDDEELPGADWNSFTEATGRPDRKEIERIKRRHRLDPANVPSWVTMLDTRPAAEHIAEAGDEQEPKDLFGPLWRTGEVAVLFGEASAGKSILATQIADAIAAGKRCPTSTDNPTEDDDINPFLTTAGPQKVVHFDFELTAAQFTARYTCPATGEAYRFSENHLRSVIDRGHPIPEAFRGDATKFLLHSVMSAVDTTEARVLVIDNLNYLTRTAGAGTQGASLMKNLRLFAHETEVSILIVAGARRRLHATPIQLTDLAAHRTIAQLADSVFAIGPTPQDPSLRYIKHLKSRTAPPHLDENNVAVCRLTRTASDRLRNSPPVLGGVAPAAGDGVVIPHSTFDNRNSSTPQPPDSPSPDSPSPVSPTPFLAFEFLGLCTESEAIHDPKAHTARLHSAQKTLRRERNRQVIDFLMSPDYTRYLKS